MFEIDGVEAKYGKYANNTEFAGDQFTTGWTLPLEFNLTVDQFEAAFDRKYMGRQLFNEKKGEKYSAWKGFVKGPLPIAVDYDNCGFAIVFTGGKTVEFDDGCRVSKIFFDAIDGGMIAIECNVYVHPSAQQKKLLEQFQHSTVTVSFEGGELAARVKDKQKDMFDGKGAEKGDGEDADGKDASGVGAGFAAAAAEAQVAAFNRGTPVDDSNGAASDKH